MAAIYDRIGVEYSRLRRADPRLATAIDAALGDARTVLNVGAGTGSYEPECREVTALEPSMAMIRQRGIDEAPVIQGSAEAIPFADDSYDAAMAVLTIHHWSDCARGLREMRRVARDRVVLVTFDPNARPWLTDYLPQVAELDEQAMPTMEQLAGWLGPLSIEPLPVPRDCTDGFLYAYWARPSAYLDPRVRKGSSAFWQLDGLEAGLDRLAEDIRSGEWTRRYADLLDCETYDAGYRLVIARA